MSPVRIADRYELGPLVGRGAMGAVYAGVDTHTGQPVAIKVLRPDLVDGHPEMIERFRREGQVLRLLNHPNIVAALAAEETDGRHYLVMEYVGGGTLADLLRRQPQLPLERALAIALELADALARTHHLHVVHRDIKPANILLAEDGTPRLTDFGLAFSPSDSRLTQPGLAVGTWLYCSPEVCRGATANVRSDVWSFGVVLYEMLAGRPPFRGDSLPAIVDEITNAPLLSVRRFREDVPPALDQLIARMLAKDAVLRIGSFRQIGAELEALARGAQPPWPAGPVAPAEPESEPLSVEIDVQWTDEASAPAADAAPRLWTRLTAPPVPKTHFRRSRLFARLNDDVHHKRTLTLVCAPAGFGKTTLVGGWLASGHRPAAWLTLDSGDDDPVAFLQDLLAALQQVDPRLGLTTGYLLDAPQRPPVASLLTPLVNDLATTPALTLVLDDYQTVTADAVHQMVQFLLDHLPPGQHVVLLTREEPPLRLARLRLSERMSEIRARDLRLTPDEAAPIVRAALPSGLSDAALALLVQRTEGWVAGVQLAALALRDSAVPVEAALRDFSGDNRYVLDYLLSEVIDHLPPDQRTFLRQTSILDRLTAPLCDAVTGAPTGQTMLDALERTNLFLQPLDAHRTWYRYHPLFADALRNTLPEAERAALHRRAAGWFEAQASTADAVAHALSAAGLDDDYADALRLIHAHVEATFADGRITTIQHWLERLPDPVLETSPQLGVYRAWVDATTGQVDAARARADALDRRLRATPESTATDALRIVQALLALTSGDFAAAIAQAQAAVAPTQPLAPQWRMIALWVLAEAQERSRPITQAIDTLRAASAVSRQRHVFAALLDASLIHALNLHGERQQALTLSADALRRATDAHGQPLPVAALILSQQVFLHYDANALDAAETCLRQAQALAEQMGFDEVTTVLLAQSALLDAARGDDTAARAGVTAALTLASTDSLADHSWISAIEATLALAQGRRTAARDWATRNGLGPNAAPDYLHIEQHIVYARLLLAEGQHAAAEAWLARLDAFAAERGYRRARLSIRIWQALAAHAADDPERAATLMADAVRRAAPGGYLRAFIDADDAVFELLAAAHEAAPAFVDALFEAAGPSWHERSLQALRETLTDAEIGLANMIASGLSNAEIGRRLSLAAGSARQSVNQLTRKLGAQSRTQAVQLARRLRRDTPDDSTGA